jgi:hypothetical protein
MPHSCNYVIAMLGIWHASGRICGLKSKQKAAWINKISNNGYGHWGQNLQVMKDGGHGIFFVAG